METEFRNISPLPQHTMTKKYNKNVLTHSMDNSEFYTFNVVRVCYNMNALKRKKYSS